MRAKKLLLFPALVSLVLASVVAPARAAMLFGSDDPASDVPLLQTAASAGGEHVLNGTFNLGPAGRILLTRDVTFEGGTGPRGAKAVIRGGDWAFLSPLPFSTDIPSTMSPFALPPITAAGPRIVIRNLEFDGPVGAAIHIAYASHLEVTGNVIRNVHRRQLTPPFARHAGIDVGTQTYLVGMLRAPDLASTNPYFHLAAANNRRRQNSFVPGAITGEVTIASNVIEVDPAEDDALDDSAVVPSKIASRSQGYGVFLDLLDGATVRIVENTISGATRTGITAVEPRFGPTGSGSFLIEKNLVVTPRRGVYNPNITAPNGIEAGWFFDPAGAADGARNVPQVIRRNRIEMNGRSERVPAYGNAPSASLGIGVFSDRSVVENNVVTETNPAHIGISMTGSNALIKANRIEGLGLLALRAITSRDQVMVPDTNPAQFVVTAANANSFVGNNIARFVSQRTDDFPRASDIVVLAGGGVAPENNTFIGLGNSNKVSVFDEGWNTVITGYAPVAGGLRKDPQEPFIEPAPIKLH